MPAPAFAVVRRSQQSVRHARPGLRRFLSQKGVDLPRSRRQACPRIEEEVAAELAGAEAVAFVTVVHQNRANPALEEFDLLRGRVRDKRGSFDLRNLAVSRPHFETGEIHASVAVGAGGYLEPAVAGLGRPRAEAVPAPGVSGVGLLEHRSVVHQEVELLVVIAFPDIHEHAVAACRHRRRDGISRGHPGFDGLGELAECRHQRDGSRHVQPPVVGNGRRALLPRAGAVGQRPGGLAESGEPSLNPTLPPPAGGG